MMKKVSSGPGGSAAKGSPPPKDIDEYLAAVPEPARGTLEKLRATIRSAAPAEATEAISYRIPTFKYKGALLAFAAFSKHCSLFPMSYSVMKMLKNELRDFDVSKGTIHFTAEKPLPDALVKKLVKARLAEKHKAEKHKKEQKK
jgi:uncharacterized protein YdhG (YjbR/CyaY superfamily)